jgi:hypothetical protein
MKPIASYWIMGGMTGKRVGTGYCHTKQEAEKKSGEIGFRWLKRATKPKGE